MPTLTRVLVILCVGAAAILAWKSYSDEVRQLITSSYPQLGWLTPNRAPGLSGLASQAAPTSDQQRLNVISVDLDAMRQTVDRIAVTQEQITRNIDQLAASQERMRRNVDQLAGGQEQMMREISKLQAGEQQRRQRSAEALLRPARKPVPQPAYVPTAH